MKANYQILKKEQCGSKDDCDKVKDQLLNREQTKNIINTKLNNLKPEIKQMQTERGNFYRYVQYDVLVKGGLKLDFSALLDPSLLF